MYTLSLHFDRYRGWGWLWFLDSMMLYISPDMSHELTNAIQYALENTQYYVYSHLPSHIFTASFLEPRAEVLRRATVQRGTLKFFA